MSRVFCKKGPTRHVYAWQIGPFWQDTLDVKFTWDLFPTCDYILTFDFKIAAINHIVFQYLSLSIRIMYMWFTKEANYLLEAQFFNICFYQNILQIVSLDLKFKMIPIHSVEICHDDVIKWKHFPRNWPFVRGIHRSAVNSPHKGQWRGALMFSLICVWINDWVNNREAGDLRRYRAHYDVIVMSSLNH